MATSSSVSLDSICAGPTWINLPKEIWEIIWSFLDYHALQKICTLVSKTWLENIRDSPTLSGELILKISESDPSVEVIKDILSHWTKLKVLHFKTNQELGFEFGMKIGLAINSTLHPMLRKVITPSPNSFEPKELGKWGKVKEIWFDPKQVCNPSGINKIFSLEISTREIPNVIKYETIIGTSMVPLETIGQITPNVETLSLYGFPYLNLIKGFKYLKNLNVVEKELPVDWLLRYLQNIEEVKNLRIIVDVSVNAWSSDFQTTQTIFKNALKLVHKKFPKKSTELKIVEQDQGYEVRNRKYFRITKLKDNAPEIEIRSKNVHGEFIAEEMFYDEKFDIFESITYEYDFGDTTENSSEASEFLENSTNEEMENTDENSDTEGLNDSNETDAEEMGSSNEQGNENSDTKNSG